MDEFPIKSLDELKAFEEKLNENVLPTYIDAVKNIVLPSGITKSFPKLFDKEVFLNYNFDGIKGKLSFRDLKNINNLLYCALDMENLADYKQLIKKAFKLSKNAHFKSVSVQNKKNCQSMDSQSN